jgi:hypothetical protein
MKPCPCAVRERGGAGTEVLGQVRGTMEELAPTKDSSRVLLPYEVHDRCHLRPPSTTRVLVMSKVREYVNVCSPACSRTVNETCVHVHGVRKHRTDVYMNDFQRSAGRCTQPAAVYMTTLTYSRTLVVSAECDGTGALTLQEPACACPELRMLPRAAPRPPVGDARCRCRELRACERRLGRT